MMQGSRCGCNCHCKAHQMLCPRATPPDVGVDIELRRLCHRARRDEAVRGGGAEEHVAGGEHQGEGEAAQLGVEDVPVSFFVHLLWVLALWCVCAAVDGWRVGSLHAHCGGVHADPLVAAAHSVSANLLVEHDGAGAERDPQGDVPAAAECVRRWVAHGRCPAAGSPVQRAACSKCSAPDFKAPPCARASAPAPVGPQVQRGRHGCPMQPVGRHDCCEGAPLAATDAFRSNIRRAARV